MPSWPYSISNYEQTDSVLFTFHLHLDAPKLYSRQLTANGCIPGFYSVTVIKQRDTQQFRVTTVQISLEPTVQMFLDCGRKRENPHRDREKIQTPAFLEPH